MSIRNSLIAVCSYSLLTALTAGKEFLHPHTIPLTSTTVSTVPLFNAWTIGWNADQLAAGFPYYWHAPIFHPQQSSFAYSEPQPATMLVAPILWSTGNPIWAYKSWLILSLFLNALFGHILLRRMGYSFRFQLFGGLLVFTLPLVHQFLDVIQLVPLWGILWFWGALFQLERRRQILNAMETGISFATVFMLCLHHALFLCLLMCFALAMFLGPLVLDRRFAILSGLAILLAALLVAPIVLPVDNALAGVDHVRPDMLVQQLSAKPSCYLNSPDSAFLKMEAFQSNNELPLNVGYLRMLLASVGLVLGLTWGKRKRWIGFVAVIGLVAFCFSLGFHLKIAGWSPWRTIRDVVPGFESVRSVYRFAWFVQLTITLLAVEGAALLHEFAASTRLASTKKLAFQIVIGVFAIGGLIEIPPASSIRGGVPDLVRNEKWIGYLREETPTDAVIFCVPAASGTTIADYDHTTRWMYFGLRHDRRLVNGYSGFFPEDYLELRKLIQAEFPSAACLRELVDRDVTYLVVARRFCSTEKMLDLPKSAPQLDLVFQDDVGIDIYRLNADANR